MSDFPAYAPEEDLLAAVRSDSRHRVRVFAPQGVAVVLGRGSRPERELHLDAVRDDRVPIVRRRGGGCAVVLDPGNVVVSVVLAMPGVGGISGAYDSIAAWLIDALARVGVHDVRREGVSDLVLGDRKVGGSCIYRTLGLLHYGCTLLVDPDPDLVDRYLKHPPREPAYRAGREHREFLGKMVGAGAVTDAAALASLLAGLPPPHVPQRL